MAAMPDRKPPTKIGKEPMQELNQPITPAEPSRTLPIPASAEARARTPRKQGRSRAKKGKLQLVLPAIVLWRLKIAAANDGMSVRQVMMKFITEPLKSYSYPTLPEWLKNSGESGDDSSAAA
jgi:hypothetical protein